MVLPWLEAYGLIWGRFWAEGLFWGWAWTYRTMSSWSSYSRYNEKRLLLWKSCKTKQNQSHSGKYFYPFSAHYSAYTSLIYRQHLPNVYVKHIEAYSQSSSLQGSGFADCCSESSPGWSCCPTCWWPWPVGS